MERLTRHLNKGVHSNALKSYLTTIHKWVPATQLRNQRKDKIKTPLIYRGKKHDAYLSHVKVQILLPGKIFILYWFMELLSIL